MSYKRLCCTPNCLFLFRYRDHLFFSWIFQCAISCLILWFPPWERGSNILMTLNDMALFSLFEWKQCGLFFFFASTIPNNIYLMPPISSHHAVLSTVLHMNADFKGLPQKLWLSGKQTSKPTRNPLCKWFLFNLNDLKMSISNMFILDLAAKKLEMNLKLETSIPLASPHLPTPCPPHYSEI